MAPARSACHIVSCSSRQTLRPRAGKLASGPSSRSKFSSGAAAPRAAILAAPAHFNVVTHGGSSRRRQNFGCQAGSKHGQGARHVLMPIMKLGVRVEHGGGRPVCLKIDAARRRAHILRRAR